jgi:hypothetical protein
MVAGRHRLEALRANGEDRIPAYLLTLSDLEVRVWEVSEPASGRTDNQQRYEQSRSARDWPRTSEKRKNVPTVGMFPEAGVVRAEIALAGDF